MSGTEIIPYLISLWCSEETRLDLLLAAIEDTGWYLTETLWASETAGLEYAHCIAFK